MAYLKLTTIQNCWWELENRMCQVWKNSSILTNNQLTSWVFMYLKYFLLQNDVDVAGNYKDFGDYLLTVSGQVGKCQFKVQFFRIFSFSAIKSVIQLFPLFIVFDFQYSIAFDYHTEPCCQLPKYNCCTTVFIWAESDCQLVWKIGWTVF